LLAIPRKKPFFREFAPSGARLLREVDHAGQEGQAASDSKAMQTKGRQTIRKTSLPRLVVRRRAGNPCQGWLTAGPFVLPVALGRGGIKANKHEGDGATPRGRFRLKRLWWRADRHPRPATALPARRIGTTDGWCEDPRDRHYNRPVNVAPGSSADRLARADDLYDFIIEIDHNTRPRIAGRGSAVFIHAARLGFAPTAGCIGLRLSTLRRLLARLGPQTRIVVD
jgi:L,D-peptidoglycan transpeptidase YkuD (ErfK/YbiS/YcfS/YnhG family)